MVCLFLGLKQRRKSTARRVVSSEGYMLLTAWAPMLVLGCRGLNVCLGGFPGSPEGTETQARLRDALTLRKD